MDEQKDIETERKENKSEVEDKQTVKTVCDLLKDENLYNMTSWEEINNNATEDASKIFNDFDLETTVLEEKDFEGKMGLSAADNSTNFTNPTDTTDSADSTNSVDKEQLERERLEKERIEEKKRLEEEEKQKKIKALEEEYHRKEFPEETMPEFLEVESCITDDITDNVTIDNYAETPIMHDFFLGEDNDEEYDKYANPHHAYISDFFPVNNMGANRLIRTVREELKSHNMLDTGKVCNTFSNTFTSSSTDIYKYWLRYYRSYHVDYHLYDWRNYNDMGEFLGRIDKELNDTILDDYIDTVTGTTTVYDEAADKKKAAEESRIKAMQILESGKYESSVDPDLGKMFAKDSVDEETNNDSNNDSEESEDWDNVKRNISVLPNVSLKELQLDSTDNEEDFNFVKEREAIRENEKNKERLDFLFLLENNPNIKLSDIVSKMPDDPDEFDMDEASGYPDDDYLNYPVNIRLREERNQLEKQRQRLRESLETENNQSNNEEEVSENNERNQGKEGNESIIKNSIHTEDANQSDNANIGMHPECCHTSDNVSDNRSNIGNDISFADYHFLADSCDYFPSYSVTSDSDYLREDNPVEEVNEGSNQSREILKQLSKEVNGDSSFTLKGDAWRKTRPSKKVIVDKVYANFIQNRHSDKHEHEHKHGKIDTEDEFVSLAEIKRRKRL